MQALGRLPHGLDDPFVQGALLAARSQLSDEELDRGARLPLPELTPDHPAPTLRALFEGAIALSFEEEDGG